MGTPHRRYRSTHFEPTQGAVSAPCGRTLKYADSARERRDVTCVDCIKALAASDTVQVGWVAR